MNIEVVINKVVRRYFREPANNPFVQRLNTTGKYRIVGHIGKFRLDNHGATPTKRWIIEQLDAETPDWKIRFYLSEESYDALIETEFVQSADYGEK